MSERLSGLLNIAMPSCPCGSDRDYARCCQPYLVGQANPESPEILMRSRYTAYTMADIDYIQKTQRGKAAVGFNALDACVWAKRVTWIKLEILSANLENSKKGYVEFVATFVDGYRSQAMHEKSEFIKKSGQWFYVDGIQVP